MIYYPLMRMKEMGMTSVLIVTGRGHAGSFLELLGNGSEFGLSLSYEVQEEAGGIAQALALAENFIGDQEKFVVMLGDNIYEDDLKPAFDAFLASDEKAYVFLKEVERPSSYGVPKLENGQITEIIEKPADPPSQYAVTGCYMYTRDVFDFVKNLEPSARGELEISDVNDHYVKNGLMGHTVLDGFWGDCGESFEGMMDVANYVMKIGL
jgi:glucose-1-phosphate thymidylyltransferase